jgi:putative tryptophan/tyrosine transport system substrate-binding protein
MRRREFIAGLGSAAGWPAATRAQQQTPVIGYLAARSLEADRHLLAAFRESLAGLGFIEGQNVRIDYRFADGQRDKLDAMAMDLVNRGVTLIAASTLGAAQAAKNATTVIPIVFSIGNDPVTSGMVTSLSHPSSNRTGVTTFASEAGSKQYGLVHELVPAPAVIGFLYDSKGLPFEGEAFQSAARSLNRELVILNANSEAAIDAVFLDLGRQHRIGGLLVSSGVFLATRLNQIVVLANHYKIPAVYTRREWTLAGGLMSYGTNFVDAYRQLGMYAGKILKGATPAELPVLLPTKFELVINLKTAKALGLTIPETLLATADEVIQ